MFLVTNGDSFTYGDELIGSRPPAGEEPTHMHKTYTHHLGSHLRRSYVNLAQNGSSNMKIYRTTMDFLQKTSKEIEYMVILWSSWGRMEVCEPFTLEEDVGMYIGRETDMNQLIPSHRSGSFMYRDQDLPVGYDDRNAGVKSWFENAYSMETSIVHCLTYMKNIQWVCDLKGIKLLQGTIHEAMWNNILFTYNKAEENNEYQGYRDFIDFSLAYLRPESKIGLGQGRSFHEYCVQKGHEILPGGHPNLHGHQDYANYLFGIILDSYGEPIPLTPPADSDQPPV